MPNLSQKKSSKKSSFFNKRVVSSSSSEYGDHQTDLAPLPQEASESSIFVPHVSMVVKDIVEPIQDGLDQYEFDMAIEDRVQEIQREMLTYGDAQMDRNDLRNVEFRIQSERLLSVLDRCIDHVNMMFHMPSLLESQKSYHIEALQNMDEPDRRILKETYNAFRVTSDSMVWILKYVFFLN